MNGTAEAILDELLKNSKAQTEILKKLAQSFKPTTGGGSGGPGGGGLGGLAAAATDVVKNFNPMIKAISMVADLLGSFASGIGAIIGGIADLGGHLFDLAKKAAEGKARLHDLFDAFADLPLGIGKLAGLFSSMVKVSEGLLDSYRTLTESGASFGGELIEVSNIATRAGLTIDELNGIVAKNSEIFASMGGSVADGITKFGRASIDLLGPDSEFKMSIFGMGYTASQATEALATVIKSQGAMGRNSAASAEKLASYTASYLTQLDELAKITGKHREQIDKEVQKAEDDQSWQLFLDSITNPEAKQTLLNAIAEASAKGGDTVVELVKNSARGIDVPFGHLSEKLTNLAILSGGAGVQFGSLVRGLPDGTTSMKQFRSGLNNLIQSTGKNFESFGSTMQVVNQGMADPAILSSYRKGALSTNALIKSQADEIQSRMKNAAQLANSEQSLKLLGMSIMNIVYRVLQPFTDIIIKVSDSLLEDISTWFNTESPLYKDMEKGVKWLTEAITFIADHFHKGFGEGVRALFGKVGEGLGKVWEIVKDPILNIFHKIGEMLKLFFKSIFRDLMDMINSYLYHHSLHILGTSPETQKAQTNLENAQDELDYLKAELKDAQDSKSDLSTITTLQKKISEQQSKVWALDSTKRGLTGEQFSDEASNARFGTNFQPTFQPVDSRAAGSLGATGNLFENWGKETPVNLHGTESVVTPEQMGRIISGAGQNTLSADLKQLNTLTQQLLNYMKQTADNTRRTHDATRALSGNMLEAF